MRRVAAAAFTLLLLLMSSSVAADEPVRVEAALDREVTAIGDRITLTLTVFREPGYLIAPLQTLDLGPDIEVVEAMQPQHETLAGGTTRSVFRFAVAAFRTGELQLPPIPVTSTGPGGAVEVVRSNAVSFRIRSVIPPGEQPTDIKDLKPQLQLPGPASSSYYRPALMAILALDLALLALGIRRHRRRPSVVAAESPAAVPDYATQLDELSRLGLIEGHDFKELYRALARIVRAYLGERYDLPARALTRRELDLRMQAAGLDRWQARLVSGLLQESDRVVYAQYHPAPERAEGDLQLAYQIVTMGEARAAEAAVG